MEKLIQSQLGRIEQIQEEFNSDLDSSLKTIEIKAVIDNPVDELMKIANLVKDLLESKYYKRCIDGGEKFAQKVEDKID